MFKRFLDQLGAGTFFRIKDGTMEIGHVIKVSDTNKEQSVVNQQAPSSYRATSSSKMQNIKASQKAIHIKSITLDPEAVEELSTEFKDEIQGVVSQIDTKNKKAIEQGNESLLQKGTEKVQTILQTQQDNAIKTIGGSLVAKEIVKGIYDQTIGPTAQLKKVNKHLKQLTNTVEALEVSIEKVKAVSEISAVVRESIQSVNLSDSKFASISQRFQSFSSNKEELASNGMTIQIASISANSSIPINNYSSSTIFLMFYGAVAVLLMGYSIFQNIWNDPKDPVFEKKIFQDLAMNYSNNLTTITDLATELASWTRQTKKTKPEVLEIYKKEIENLCDSIDTVVQTHENYVKFRQSSIQNDQPARQLDKEYECWAVSEICIYELEKFLTKIPN